jgi:hypothetical protein
MLPHWLLWSSFSSRLHLSMAQMVSGYLTCLIKTKCECGEFWENSWKAEGEDESTGRKKDNLS